MTPLLNLLKALGIVLGAYLLLFAGIWAILCLRYGTIRLSDIGLKETDPTQISLAGVILILVVLPVLMTFRALYLPPRGRLYAAIGTLLLILGAWICIGIQISNLPSS